MSKIHQQQPAKARLLLARQPQQIAPTWLMGAFKTPKPATVLLAIAVTKAAYRATLKIHGRLAQG